ncbi:Tetraacyldisaccharide 4'-kinase [Paraburkholderia unamae]|nr:Tetraacyldisaccharide 4'-kinase [Paraburkholderia unamae]
MAQSPFFPRHMPHQMADASKERLPLIPNLSAQGRRQRSFIQRGRRHTKRNAPVPAVRRTAMCRRNGFPQSQQLAQVHVGSPHGRAGRPHRTAPARRERERCANRG